LLAAAAVVGVGFGVLVVALNTLFAAGFGDRGAAMLNLLGACFGAGAILGPLAFAASGGFRGPFLGGAVLAAAAIAAPRHTIAANSQSRCRARTNTRIAITATSAANATIALTLRAAGTDFMF